MSEHNPKAMNKEELEKHIEKDFLPSLLSNLPNIQDLAAENARLKAEVERLTEAHSDALADFWAIHKGYFDLKAEVERLRASSFVTAVPVEEYEKLKAEVERLTMIKDACKRMIKRRDKWIFERKAEVERLRKAGDAMASSIQFNEEMEQDYNGPTIVRQCVKDWNAAKEGKQP